MIRRWSALERLEAEVLFSEFLDPPLILLIETRSQRVDRPEPSSAPWGILLRMGCSRNGLVLLAIIAGLMTSGIGGGLDIADRLSPRNVHRPARSSTRYIVLHTTEGGDESALRKLRARGEAHYLVTTRGKVFRIVDKRKIATHCGRSMWEGRSNLDHVSLGVEVVGYHYREPTGAQLVALRELLRQLKSLYRIRDENVVTHAMVAYGAPNRFHSKPHRGRKRCGMIFARPEVRQGLGLPLETPSDSDVRRGRLAIGDPELHAYLYQGRLQPTVSDQNKMVIGPGRTAWYFARELYARPETQYVFPDGQVLRGDEVEDWGSLPAGTEIRLSGEEEEETAVIWTLARGGEAAAALAGSEAGASTTIYFLPTGSVRTGQELSKSQAGGEMLASLPAGTRLLIGYVYGGFVTATRPPIRIAGSRWDYPSTFYRYPSGEIRRGDEVDAAAIPRGTLIFFQQ